MTEIYLSTLEGIEKPELVFGLVAPVGTPLRHLSEVLSIELRDFGYETSIIHLSGFLNNFSLQSRKVLPADSEYDRFNALMDRGNELRKLVGGGEAMSLLAAAEIQSRRPEDEPRALSGNAFVINQLKHPDEVVWLRAIYGSAFHLIAVSCPEDVRKHYLHIGRNMTTEEAGKLIERDKGEEISHGQKVTETFQHADVFIDLKNYDIVNTNSAEKQIRRYLQLLFGHKIITPTREEYGMFLAQSASFRTADLSRQVGAAILTPNGEVVALGCNEVPMAGGGQYWESLEAKRDFEIGKDENAKIKFENLEEILENLSPDYAGLTPEEKESKISEASHKLKNTRVMNLTEFGRAIHAEMEAILAAGRIGVSVRNFDLFCTTFPCHNCAKHIVDAGIKRVVYIEPYPKSLAYRLHRDAITMDPTEGINGDKVTFESFFGVAPRMYSLLFSTVDRVGNRIKRKDANGDVDFEPAGLRTKNSPQSYIQRELVASLLIRQLDPGEKAQEIKYDQNENLEEKL